MNERIRLEQPKKYLICFNLFTKYNIIENSNETKHQ